VLLNADAEIVACENPGETYRNRLHQRLVDTYHETEARPLAAIDRFIDRLAVVGSRVPSRVRAGLAAMAVFAGLSLFLASQVLSPINLPPADYPLGHMSYLRLQTQPSGRVCAWLATQTAIPRRPWQEVLP